MKTDAIHTQAAEATTPRDLLLADHRQLEGLITKLVASVEAGDGPSVVAPWRAFEAGLLAHMSAEESQIFPAFIREHASEVASLKAEHDELRAGLEKLGIEVELHEARLETISAMLDRLRAHAVREESTLYPWVDHWAAPAFVRELRERLAHATG